MRRARVPLLVVPVALVAVLVAVLLADSGGAPAPAPAPRPAVTAPLPPRVALGVNASALLNPPGPGAAVLDRHLAGIARAGLRTVRTDAQWLIAEPRPGAFDWRQADGVALALARHGLRWWPVLDFAPPWAGTVPGSLHSPPRDPEQFAAFAASFARRYGRGGDFWRAHPEVRGLPVRDYELWNEPDVAMFWPPAPDPAAYAADFVAAAAAVRGVDPEARTVLGGFAPSRTWLPAVLRAAPAARPLLSAVALHPYATTPAGVVGHVAALRAQLAAAGLARTPIDVTEVGWETSPPTARWYASDARRAAWLAETAHALARPALGVGAYLPYAWATRSEDPDVEDDWYGLVPPAGTDQDTAGTRALAGLAR